MALTREGNITFPSFLKFCAFSSQLACLKHQNPPKTILQLPIDKAKIKILYQKKYIFYFL
tara:strand:- start:343 stop:522 length:180 start_codon:yes stop_codon:yes gene_type:complete